MGSMINLVCMYYCILMLSPTDGYKILILPVPLYSRIHYCAQLGLAFGEHGHQATLIVPSSMPIPEQLKDTNITLDSYKDSGDYDGVIERVREEVLGGSIFGLSTIAMKEMEYLLNDRNLYHKLKQQQFDHCIVDYGVPDNMLLCKKLGIPFSVVSIECPGAGTRQPYLPSYVPHYTTPFSDQMNFLQRGINFVAYILGPVLESRFPFTSTYNVTLRNEFLPDKAEHTLYRYLLESKLCFRLKNIVIDTPRGFHPNVVNVGNLLVKQAKTLSNELRTLVESSTKGVIIVSFGSYIDPLSDDMISKFVTAFKRIDMNIIWKTKAVIKEVPDNIKILPWIPQNDLLAHKNAKLFITHGGQSSTIEAVYNGVPVITIPIFWDQNSNARMLVRKHLGLQLDRHTFTSDDLVKSINLILTDNSYTIASGEASEIMKGLPDAKHEAAFWLNHVIKFGDKHLRASSYDMYYYQVLLLDVGLVMVVCIMLVLGCCYYICKKLRHGGKTKRD